MNDRRDEPNRQRTLRFAAALAHAVPAVSLAVDCDDGSTLTVSRCRPAHIDPCQFRGLIVQDRNEPPRSGLPRFGDAVLDVRLTSGPEHLGGGLYHYRDHRGEQRWFLTELDHEQVSELLADCPIEGSDLGVTAATRPDAELGVTAVRLEAVHPAAALDLDRIAWWAINATLLGELAAACRDARR